MFISQQSGGIKILDEIMDHPAINSYVKELVVDILLFLQKGLSDASVKAETEHNWLCCQHKEANTIAILSSALLKICGITCIRVTDRFSQSYYREGPLAEDVVYGPWLWDIDD